MSKFIRTLAILIVIVTVFTMVSTVDAAGTVTEQDVWARIDRLVQLFPHGSFFTINGEACTDDIDTWSDGTKTCGHPNPCPTCHLPKVLSSNQTNILTAINEAPALKQLIKTKSSSSCLAFATFAYCYIFGHDYLNNSTKITSQTEGITEEFLDSLRVGDFVVCYLGASKKHYNIYLGHDDNYVYFYESNRFKPSMVVYEGKHKRGDGVITYNSGTTKWDKLVAYRSNTYETSGNQPATSSVYITHGYKDQTNKITNSNATVHATLHKPSSYKCEKYGIRIRKTNEWYKDRWDYFHDASATGVGETFRHVWFDLNTELNYTLEPGTSYTYQIYALVEGGEYFSTENSFTTTGSTVNHIYKLTAPDGFQTIREHAYTTSNKIYDIPSPRYVTVTKYTDDAQWGYVTYNGYSGWIKLYYVEKHDSHSYGVWHTTTNATCTAAGSKVRSCECGAKQTQSIDALGHNWSSAWTTDKASTCTTAGSKSHHCTRCTEKTAITAIPATGHAFGEWKTTTQASCTVAGEQTRKCINCSQTESKSISAIGHSFGDWTVTKQPTYNETGSEMRTCSGCNKTEAKVIAKLSLDGHTHNYGEWTVTKVAECELPGEETRTCSICSEIETREMSAQGHKFGEWQITIEPTHESEGREERACSLCNTCEQRVVGKISAPESELEIVPETEFEKSDAPDTSDRSDTQSVDSDVLTEDAVQEDTENTENTEDDGSNSVLIIAVITLAALTVVLGGVLCIVLLKKR